MAFSACLGGLRTALFLSIINLSLRFACAQTGYVYQLDTEFSGSNFFEGWDFFTGGDPTGGFVTYYSQSSAQLTGLINSSANTPTYIGADYSNVIPVNGVGRPSVRISTQKSWTHGLFIGDFGHTPGGICGTWPAFWTLGPNWPYNGEIDILEGVNQLTQNAVSLHTNVTCTIAGDPKTETGILQGANCAYYPPGGNTQGCGVLDSRSNSYGSGFNANPGGGGVYAMQWTSDFIRVWVFPRNQIPADIINLTPNPSGWGLPAANMQGSCPIDVHFQQHKIIFDNTFCGSYAGAASVWNSTIDSCATSTGYASCNAYVAAVPGAFQNSYWSINSVRVYQLQASGASSSASPYIASLQPTASGAIASTSTAPVPTPTASYCPSYNFTVIQAGAYQYEIECGYNPAGSDLGPPYASYAVHSFEDCVAGCSYWNTYNASNICGAVTYKIGTLSGGCYWKRRTGTIAKDPTYNGARMIYYAYPQVTDDPRVASASSTATTTFAQTSVTAQTYSNPTATQSYSSLVSASEASSIMGMGMGGSVSRTITRTASVAAASQSSTSPVLSSAAPISTTTTAAITEVNTAVITTVARVSTTFAQGTSTMYGPTSSTSAIVAVTSSSNMLVASTTSLAPITTVTVSSIGVPQTSSTISKVWTTSSMPAPTLSTPGIPANTPSFTLSMTAQAENTASHSHTATPVSAQASSLATTSPITTSAPPPPPATAETLTAGQTPQDNGIPSGGNGDATLTAPSSETATPTGQPESVDGFRYGGCQGSSSSLTGFYLVEDSPEMYIEQCISDCYNSAYAGLSATSCYCGDNVDATDDLTSFPDSECNIPCPGSPNNYCGGVISGQNLVGKRQSGMGGTTEILLTIYENELLVPDSGAAAPSTSSTDTSTTATSTRPPLISTSSAGIALLPPSSLTPAIPSSSLNATNLPVSTMSSSFSSSIAKPIQTMAVSSSYGLSSSSSTGSIVPVPGMPTSTFIYINIVVADIRKLTVLYLAFSGGDAILVDAQSDATPLSLTDGVLTDATNGKYIGAESTYSYVTFSEYTSPPANYKGWVLSSNGSLSWNDHSFTLGGGSAIFCLSSDDKMIIEFKSAPSFSCNPVSLVPVVIPPGAGSTPPSPESPLTAHPPFSSSLESVSLPSIFPIIVSTVWVEVCDVCEHGTTELATTITVPHCGCTASINMAGGTVTVPAPCVPMTVTVEECRCGEGGASSSTTLTVPCSSAIAEASSIVASAMAAWTTEHGAQCPTPVPWYSQVIAAGATGSFAAPHETARTRPGDVPETTTGITSAAGIYPPNNGTVSTPSLLPVTTKTVTLQASNATASHPAGAPLAPSRAAAMPPAVTIKKSEAAETPRFAMSIGAALVGILTTFLLL